MRRRLSKSPALAGIVRDLFSGEWNMPELGLWDRSVPIDTRDRVGMAQTLDALHLPKKARALHHGRRLVTGILVGESRGDRALHVIIGVKFTLPKRRFWKTEQTFQNTFSKHFSRA